MASMLGVVASARRWGNGEILVRQVLRGAEAEGAALHLLRLTDLHLELCTGCLRCAIGRRPCPLDDDLAWLLDTLSAADGLVLAAPTYFLSPPAAIKLVLDRLLVLASEIEQPLPRPRPAVTIATAGLQEWRGLVLPYLNALVSALGYRPVESLMALAPGPGEVLLDEPLLEQALSAGRRLAQGDLEAATAPPNVCPTCRCDAFVIAADRATCPICGRQATMQHSAEGICLCFDEDDGAGQRWTAEALRHHVVDWVVATGPRFLERRSEIKARRSVYRDMDAGWLYPPRRTEG